MGPTQDREAPPIGADGFLECGGGHGGIEGQWASGMTAEGATARGSDFGLVVKPPAFLREGRPHRQGTSVAPGGSATLAHQCVTTCHKPEYFCLHIGSLLQRLHASNLPHLTNSLKYLRYDSIA
jgi:hypothetical protein